MPTIQHIVQDIIRKRPFLQEALSRGIVNNAALSEELIPKTKKEREEFCIYVESHQWDFLFSKNPLLHELIPLQRTYLESHPTLEISADSSINMNKNRELSPQYRLERIQDSHISNDSMKNHNILMAHIQGTWRSMEEFLQRGFGWISMRSIIYFLKRALMV